MHKLKLSPMQKRIVENTEGPMLVKASAGSGKTRVLTERVRYLLEEKKGRFKIMALTFTNKAAEEMKERLENLPDLSRRTYIGTIHSFCLEVIRNQGAAIGIKQMPHILESSSDRKKVIQNVFESNSRLERVLKEYNNDDSKKLFQRCLDYIIGIKRGLYLHGIDESNFKKEEYQILYEQYQNLLVSQNTIDFDDLLLLAYRIFVERPEIAELYRRLYRYICIDEAQDLTFAHYKIIKTICGDSHRNVLMVGDPNQAIYGFNGSDTRFMLKHFLADFQAETVDLKDNYRSSRAVIRMANAITPGAINIDNSMIDGISEIKDFDDEDCEAQWVLEKIKTLLAEKSHKDIEGEINLQKISVLARNKYVFKKLDTLLVKNEIPFYYKKTGEQFESESDMMRMFELGLRVIINKLNDIHYFQIAMLLKIDEPPERTFKTGLEKLRALRAMIGEKELSEQYDILLHSWEILEKNEEKFKASLDNIDKYARSAIEVDKENGANDSDLIRISQMALIISDIETWSLLWERFRRKVSRDERTLQNFRNSIALGVIQVNQGNDGLALATVHSAKGLEFDIVFLMGMTEGTFPDYRALRSRGRAMEEEKNNAFVAVTRSKRLLYVTYPKNKEMPWGDIKVQQASRFIANPKGQRTAAFPVTAPGVLQRK